MITSSWKNLGSFFLFNNNIILYISVFVIVPQWDLVCGRFQLSNIAQSVFMLGVLIGNVLFGMFSDKYVYYILLSNLSIKIILFFDTNRCYLTCSVMIFICIEYFPFLFYSYCIRRWLKKSWWIYPFHPHPFEKE